MKRTSASILKCWSSRRWVNGNGGYSVHQPAVDAGLYLLKEGKAAQAPGDLLLVEFSRAGFPPGEWRVSVKGTVGKDKVQWSSEPKPFALPLEQQQPPRYYKGYKGEKW